VALKEQPNPNPTPIIMSEQLYTVIEPSVGGPPPGKTGTAAEILGNHPSLKRTLDNGKTVGAFTADEIAAQCVMAGQWKPNEGTETNSAAMPTSPDRISLLEQRLARLEQENAELRQKPAAANRMKPAADNR
jgi:hypothetical protein